MIANIVDRRKRPHRWKRINAIIEATWHDEDQADSDKAERPDDDDYVLYDERRYISLSDAITWAHGLPGEVTLFLYDEGVS
jgi:hypothetical protein